MSSEKLDVVSANCSANRIGDGLSVCGTANIGRHGPDDVMQAVARGEDVDPSAYYMQTHARLETGDPRYDWVNRTLFVGVGAYQKQSVKIELYALN